MAELVLIPKKKNKVVYIDISGDAEDKRLLRRGEQYLLEAERLELAELFCPAWLKAGEDVHTASERLFLEADYYLPLMSPNFFANSACCSRFERALEFSARGRGLVVLPCLLLPTRYELRLGAYPYVLPADRSPMGGRPKAWSEVAGVLCQQLTNAANHAAIARRHEARTEDVEAKPATTTIALTTKEPR